jgi:hypothetical protein
LKVYLEPSELADQMAIGCSLADIDQIERSVSITRAQVAMLTRASKMLTCPAGKART